MAKDQVFSVTVVSDIGDTQILPTTENFIFYNLEEATARFAKVTNKEMLTPVGPPPTWKSAHEPQSVLQRAFLVGDKWYGDDQCDVSYASEYVLLERLPVLTK